MTSCSLRYQTENAGGFLEVVEDYYQLGDNTATSQCPISNWHFNMGDLTLAEAISDRWLYNIYRTETKGDSIRIRSPVVNRESKTEEVIEIDGK